MNVVPKAEWSGYLNRASRAIIGLRAEIEVASLELGDQIEAQYLPITGIFYDHKDDLVGVTLEGLDHMIRHPQSIYVEASPDGLSDRDGTNHLIKLKRPLALPAPDQ